MVCLVPDRTPCTQSRPTRVVQHVRQSCTSSWKGHVRDMRYSSTTMKSVVCGQPRREGLASSTVTGLVAADGLGEGNFVRDGKNLNRVRGADGVRTQSIPGGESTRHPLPRETNLQDFGHGSLFASACSVTAPPKGKSRDRAAVFKEHPFPNSLVQVMALV